MENNKVKDILEAFTNGIQETLQTIKNLTEESVKTKENIIELQSEIPFEGVESPSLSNSIENIKTKRTKNVLSTELSYEYNKKFNFIKGFKINDEVELSKEWFPQYPLKNRIGTYIRKVKKTTGEEIKFRTRSTNGGTLIKRTK